MVFRILLVIAICITVIYTFVFDTDTPSQHVYINESQCPFPVLDPFDPKIMPFITKHPTLECSGNIPSVVYADINELRVDLAKVKDKLKIRGFVTCKYRNISMKPGDSFSIKYGPWSKPFNKYIRFFDHEEYFHVECIHENTLVSKSFITLVREKHALENNRHDDYVKHIKTHQPKETLSVLLVGIDGMSKENLIRTMPKTRNFLLEKLDAIEFKKFNKVGDNTFPNIIPLLTGLHEKELPSYWNVDKTFDNINHLFLWNRYQRAGYRSSILLDNAYRNAFHYLRKGWAYPPVDYFPRPIEIASEFDNKYFRKTSIDCMGEVPEINYLFDYWVEFATLFNKTSTPYFGYSFFTRQCHDDQNLASAGDELYLKFFQDIAKKNVLNNTLIVFFSDHGLRFGSMLNTYNGVMESKMPFVQFMFPPWFQRKYPKLMENFRINTHRLITMFDIHATLSDLLTFTGKFRNVSQSDRGIPLFSEIPANRTCKEAGIPIEFCACIVMLQNSITKPKVTQALINALMQKIVAFTDDHADKCEFLQHKETKRVIRLSPETPLRNKNHFLYHLNIQTTPGDAEYEATLLFNSRKMTAKILGNVVRLNMYRGQAECMDNEFLRSFCFCKNRPSSKPVY